MNVIRPTFLSSNFSPISLIFRNKEPGGLVGFYLLSWEKREPCIHREYGNVDDLFSWQQKGVGIQFQLLSCGFFLVSDEQQLISFVDW